MVASILSAKLCGWRRSPVGGISARFKATRRSVKTAIALSGSRWIKTRRKLRAALSNELGERRDDEASEAADQRAVDADVLQIRADVALELGDQLLLLPAHDLVLDEASDLRAMLLHQRRHAAQDLLVDPVLHLVVGAQRAAERLDHGRCALVQRCRAAVVLGRQPLAEFAPQAGYIAAQRRALERLVAQAVHTVA